MVSLRDGSQFQAGETFQRRAQNSNKPDGGPDCSTLL